MQFPSGFAGANSPILHVLDGKKFAQQGDFDRAIIEFGEALQNIRHPSEHSEIEPYCEARYQRALVFQHRGKDNLALEDFAAAISMWLRSQGNPGKKNSSAKLKKCIRDAHVGRGQIYMSWGERSLAIAAFSEALQIDPHCFEAVFHRGQVHHELGDAVRSAEDFLRARQIDPSLFDAKHPHFLPPAAGVTLPETLAPTLVREVSIGKMNGKAR